MEVSTSYPSGFAIGTKTNLSFVSKLDT